MQITRKRKAKNLHRITDYAVELYQNGRASELQAELGLNAWEHSPLNPDAKPLIAPPIGFDHERSAAQARQIRDELEMKGE